MGLTAPVLYNFLNNRKGKEHLWVSELVTQAAYFLLLSGILEEIVFPVLWQMLLHPDTMTKTEDGDIPAISGTLADWKLPPSLAFDFILDATAFKEEMTICG